MHRCQEFESNLKVKQAELELLERYTSRPEKNDTPPPNKDTYERSLAKQDNDILHSVARKSLTELGYPP